MIMSSSSSQTTSLTQKQREVIGILSIGTFLEYFDLMLYIHMGVLLNDLFFPKTDYFSSLIISSFAFCSTYVFRPLGALLLGYIGDKYGRKLVLWITTTITSATCICIAVCPTHCEIGIYASIIIIICRIIQGFSAMGERTGAAVYLTEFLPAPYSYSSTCILGALAAAGSTCALLLSVLVTSFNFNWRAGFWIGATIAQIGIMARSTLKESTAFTKAKSDKALNKEIKIPDTTTISQLKFFMRYCAMKIYTPLVIFFTIVYCSQLLKWNFGYTANQVFKHNLMLTFLTIMQNVILSILCRKTDPVKIINFKCIMFIPLMLSIPLVLNSMTSAFQLFLFQAALVLLGVNLAPIEPMMYSCFFVLQRFKFAALGIGITSSLMHPIYSFGIPFTVKHLGYMGLFLFIIPTLLVFCYGFCSFKKMLKVGFT